MKKISFLALLTIVLTCAFTQYQSGKAVGIAKDTLQISLSLKHGKDTLKASDVVIDVAFKNVSAKAIRLPDIFDNLAANTYVSVSSENNRPIIPVKVAVVDYSPGVVSKYITIAPSKTFKGTISLSDILKARNTAFTGSTYKVELSYINNKGINCIKGTFYSNVVKFSIAQAPIPVVPVAPAVPVITRQTPQTQTAVSNVVTFTAKPFNLPVKPFKPLTKSTNKTGTFKDKRDGQVYTWVRIGKQTWMSQNLNYKTTTGICYSYEGDSTNANKYGMYYSYTAMQTASPKGWHVPSDEEWRQMEIAGGIPADQAAGKGGWNGDDISNFITGGSTGFNVLYSGERRSTKTIYAGERAYFWTTAEPEVQGQSFLLFRRAFIKEYNRILSATQGTGFFLPLRCVKDE